MNGAPAVALDLGRDKRILTRLATGRVTFRRPATTDCLFFAFGLDASNARPFAGLRLIIP